MTNFDNLTTEQKLRLSIHRCARAISSETCSRLGLDVTPAAADILSELVYKKLKTYGADLEAFAKHAKRNTINAEDVKLLVRRNPSLKTHISSLADSTAPAKRRKTVPPPPTTPASSSIPVAIDTEQPSTSKKQDDAMDGTNLDAEQNADLWLDVGEAEYD